MPKTKKLEDSSDSDSSGPSDRSPPKKSKVEKSSSSKSNSNDGESKWELDKRRFVTVRDFRGKVYVDIREFYEADGELKPGKKGISLTAQQWHKLKDLLPEVDEALKNF